MRALQSCTPPAARVFHLANIFEIDDGLTDWGALRGPHPRGRSRAGPRRGKFGTYDDDGKLASRFPSRILYLVKY